jgi:CheY-like chemotaxis protein
MNVEPVSALDVLVCDDDVDDLELTCDVLRASARKARPSCVSDGEALLEHLHERCGGAGRLPGLILLDLNMPRMTGREALAEIRSDPQLRHIPVVIWTTSRSQSEIDRSYALGANSFVSKPSTVDELTGTLDGLVEYWGGLVCLPGKAPA